MRISCPHCGDRTHAEFSYLGEAGPRRPVAASGLPNRDAAAFTDYVYLRANPMGRHREWWQHTGGCRAWLMVERDVSSHAITKVTAARALAGSTAR